MQFGVFWTLACTCQAGTGHDESSGRKPCFFLRLASTVDGSCRHFGSLPNGCSCRKWIPDITEAEGYGAMKIIADQVLKDTLINIDDYYFEDSAFIRCIFVFSGKTFEMKDCKIVDCRIRLAGEADRIFRLLTQFSTESMTLEGMLTAESSWVH